MVGIGFTPVSTVSFLKDYSEATTEEIGQHSENSSVRITGQKLNLRVGSAHRLAVQTEFLSLFPSTTINASTWIHRYIQRSYPGDFS